MKKIWCVYTHERRCCCSSEKDALKFMIKALFEEEYYGDVTGIIIAAANGAMIKIPGREMCLIFLLQSYLKAKHEGENSFGHPSYGPTAFEIDFFEKE